MTAHHSDPSPELVPRGSPLAIIQPRQRERERERERGSYVQRWKVLRDRNKTLPKVDFNAKASALPKRYQHVPVSVARSYTLDSIKLPSLSNASIATGYSGASVRSDNYRRYSKEREKKVSVQILVHFARWKYSNTQQQRDFSDVLQDVRESNLAEIGAGLSNSLPNIADLTEVQVKSEQLQNRKHKFERIAQSKRLSNRNDKPREREHTKIFVMKDDTETSKTKPKDDKSHTKEKRQKEKIPAHKAQDKVETQQGTSGVDGKQIMEEKKAKVDQELQFLEQSVVAPPVTPITPKRNPEPNLLCVNSPSPVVKFTSNGKKLIC